MIELLLLLKTTHPTVRLKLVNDLTEESGKYIVKLLDLFDLCELEEDKVELHRLFDIFYSLVELCDRRVIEILLNDKNFLSVVGVFGYNPGLIKEMDFRTDLEGRVGFKEVIPIRDEQVLQRVHMNYRIQVIKDNVLARSLPDSSVIMLEQMVNENNYHILTYVSDTEEYWQSIKEIIRDEEKRLGGLGLLREIIQLVRVTRPLDKLPQQRHNMFGGMPVFGTLINNLFGDGAIFEGFSMILGSPDSKIEEVELVLDILNILVFYQGPERLRTYLSSEGKCITAPRNDHERITWKAGSSLFTALIFVFERYEPTRAQMFTLLKEIFKLPLGHDDKFLSVLYPNYIHWILQPLKYSDADDEPVLFALQDSIMELLTFCTENHGYRVKYLFGRQPVASYVQKMLKSKNKLFVIHAVKFVRACVARAESFFSRFLIQNDLFSPILATLKLGGRNSCAVSSAVLELLSFVEKSSMKSLVEHIYTKYYQEYKDECPIVFNALRLRYEEHFEPAAETESEQQRAIAFVQKNNPIDADEEMYWEKDTESTPAAANAAFVTNGANAMDTANEVLTVRSDESMKLVSYADDEDEPASPLKEGDLLVESPQANKAEEELVLPVREKKDDDDPKAFLANRLGSSKKGTKSPQYKNMFQKISWKSTAVTSPSSADSSSSDDVSTSPRSTDKSDASSSSPTKACPTVLTDPAEYAETVAAIEARKRALEDAQSPEALLKKSKTCTPTARRVMMATSRPFKMIDIGANMTDPMFNGNYRGKQKHPDDYDNILQRAHAAGVAKVIITGGTLEESRTALALARKAGTAWSALFSTVGVHPTRCSEFDAYAGGADAYLAELLALCRQGMEDGRVVAIGECGLDYDRLEFCPKDVQRKYFELQFALAEATGLPMFLHNRNTDGDFYAMIAQNRHRFSNGVVHSFTGSTEEAQKLLELGLYIGINGCSLKTEENLATMKSIPTDRLMIETDAPWCDIRSTHAGFKHVKTTWPVKKAEKWAADCMVKSRNEPCTLTQVLEVCSAERGEDITELAAKIYDNTRRVFFPASSD
ncbi:TPA: hypothetical protein N0F65_009677 [Lagenidium giganteum]|uniref:Serine/threonine-protein phosphatase 4 regulatory subunit 3-like central domain-containing protein n=1 Tax=Lagenidium giganteum TaxID=4803 RepID=A0AAV2YVF5_9STRA|nr:TPA: hypothetical protein N0F65_009677 [Lagenidium giganteum]